jgi:hypothetical protein
MLHWKYSYRQRGCVSEMVDRARTKKQHMATAGLVTRCAYLVLLLAIAALQTHAQSPQPVGSVSDPVWTVSGGFGVWTIMRAEVARETSRTVSFAGTLGVHPMGFPAVETAVRIRIGPEGPVGPTYLMDMSLLGFLPGTQFANDAEPGLGVHLTVGRDDVDLRLQRVE